MRFPRAWRRLALPVAGGWAALLFGILGLCARPATAADSAAPKADAAQSPPVAALSPEQLSNAANNPNVPLTQLQLRNIVAPALPGFNGAGNTFQLQGILPIRAKYGTLLAKWTNPMKGTLWSR